MKKLQYLPYKVKYLLIGIIFGFLFPIGAIIFEIERFNLAYSTQNLIYIHKHNKLLFMIDTAPFFLGVFALLSGIIREKLDLINQKLEYQVVRDELTGLYNRRYGRRKLHECIKSIKENKPKTGIMLINIDRFKSFNDSLGHDFGDKIIIGISNRFLETRNEKERVIRTSGDEFMIIVEEFKTILDIRKIAIKYIKAFEKPLVIDSKNYNVTFSMGISIFPDHSEDILELYKYSDIAMRINKKNKKRKFEIFNRNMLKDINETFEMERNLNIAIQEKEIFLMYQPIVDAISYKIVGAEVLVRWNSKKFGMVPPSKFIPIAESTNLILEIGETVLKNACMQAQLWVEKGFNPIGISVNVSVNQLIQVDFIYILRRILKETKYNPQNLKLEITESVYMENIKEISKVVDEIKSLGVKISIDDFGTGYSSLAELKEINTNTLKVDKSFVDDINGNFNNDAIVSTIITMAKKLKVDVIAEGVETIEQLEFLKNEKCDYIQGYLFSKPLKREDFESLLVNTKEPYYIEKF